MNNKISWVLRTFISREKDIMRQLWRSMIQPIQDYTAIVWAPVDLKGELQAQEGPLRNFSKKVKGTYDLNYWQRLEFLNLTSIERRMQRFRIIYTWKSLTGNVPSLGFNTWSHPIKGKLIIYEKNTGRLQSIRTKRDQSIFRQGPKLFNSLPRCIRELDCTFDTFKKILDIFLSLIPDKPLLPGYKNGNLDLYRNETNCMVHWIRNLKLDEWSMKDEVQCTKQ